MDWTEFKTFVDTWQIKSLVRFTPKDANGHYQNIWVCFERKIFEVTGFLMAGSPELADFEANYKPEPVMTWVAGKDVSRNDIASSFPIAASQDTSFDLELTTNTWLWGGDIIVQGTGLIDGDQIKVQVVDVNGIISPAGTILRTIITKKFLPQPRSISVAAPDGSPSFILGGLFLRFVYTETQSLAKVANINLVAMS